jgi:toxin ParE1/3/4
VSGAKYRLTNLADADITDILAYTLREFGPLQFEAYWGLIDKAGQMVGEYLTRPGSRPRDDLGQGVRSFHVEFATRRGAASHILYYVAGPLEDDTPGAVILRVLWEGMEPKPFVAQGLDELGSGQSE